MSDWSEQVAAHQREWMNQQQKLFSDWVASLQREQPGTAADTWKRTADFMERQIESAIAAQRQSLKTLVDNVEHIEGLPEAYSQWVRQVEQSFEIWSGLQQSLLHTWFETLRSSSAPSTPQNAGEALFANWGDIARQAMSLQQQWISDLTGSNQKTGGGRKTAKSTGTKSSPSS